MSESERRVETALIDAKLARAQKDAAYIERNRVVAALAALCVRMGWRAGIAQTAIEHWEPEWHNCIYIDLPTGQVSWHYHDDDREIFGFLPEYKGDWDGHTTVEKYQRLEALIR